MPAGGTVVRGERFKLAFAPEATGAYGTDPGTTGYVYPFGVVQAATLADPNLEIFPIYALGNASNRNYFIAYKGKITLSGSIPDIWLLDGSILYLGVGGVVNAGTAAPYTHTISETTRLRSISVHASIYDDLGNVALMRRFHGGKVNRMSIECAEGDFLKASIDEINFINLAHNASGSDVEYYSTGVADITVQYPATQPYLFSQGALQLAGTTFARVRNFRLEVNNNLEPKFYVQNTGGARLPYEYREGRREYRLAATVDIEDNSLYKEVMRLGTYSGVWKGFQVVLTFARASGGADDITITMPPSAPATGGDAMGCLIRTGPHPIVADPIVSTNLDISVRSIGIVVHDSVSAYPGV